MVPRGNDTQVSSRGLSLEGMEGKVLRETRGSSLLSTVLEGKREIVEDKLNTLRSVGCLPARRYFRTPIDWPQREVKEIKLGYIIMYILKFKYNHSTSTKMIFFTKCKILRESVARSLKNCKLISGLLSLWLVPALGQIPNCFQVG